MSILTELARIWLTRSVRPFSFTSAYDSSLDLREEQNLGLYLHIPFCRTLCSFCPYCKVPYQEELAKAYLDALLKEIDLVGGSLPSHRQVTSLYFGGGSPALFAAEIGRIVKKLREYFEISEEIGIELHPEDVNEETLRLLKSAGVTRISIGVQSFQEAGLHALGRTLEQPEQIFDALARVPFETVSMDFIFALPGQSFEELRRDIDMAFSHGANHVAIYPFIDFTDTTRSFPKMPERQKRKLLDQITAYCAGQGYVRDSIWTFSKPGTPKYSSMTRDNFLGFGCSATTLLRGQFKINTFSIPAYLRRIEEGKLPTALTLHFTLRQRMVYYLFWAAYTTVVDAGEFEAFFGRKLDRCYGFELRMACLLGLAKKEGNRYRITPRGAYYYHYFENYYTLSYIDQMWHLLRNEAFPERLLIR